MLTFITIKNVYTIVTVNCCFLTKLVLMLSRLFYKTREIPRALSLVDWCVENHGGDVFDSGVFLSNP